MNARSTLPLHTGRAMPVLGLGTWELTRHTADTVEEALRLGYRMIDTAGDYGSQPGIGEALRRTAVARDEVFLVLKTEEDEEPLQATRRYLDEVRQQYADLVLLHRPPPDSAGEDLWKGLIQVRKEGLARDIGVSNYSMAQIDAIVDATGEVPVVNQIEWTPFGWSTDMLAYCRERDIVVQAYSPLTRAERLDDGNLTAVARHSGATPAQILLRWNLEHGVVPLPKANRVDHLHENLGAFDARLDGAAMERLDALNGNYSALGASLAYLEA